MLPAVEGLLTHILALPLEGAIQCIAGGMVGFVFGLCCRRPALTVTLQLVRGSGDSRRS
jgi:hypothetical protein